jgi:hypothetical protein
VCEKITVHLDIVYDQVYALRKWVFGHEDGILSTNTCCLVSNSC